MQVLVGEEAEELVFDDGAADHSAQGVAVQLRILVVRRHGLVLIEEERRGIEPVGGAMQIESSVIVVGAGGGAQVDVRAAGCALLCVIHRCVDADLLDGFRSGRRKRIADGEIDRGAGLNDAAAAGVAHAGAGTHAIRGYLAGALAVEQVAGVDAVEQEAVAGVALAVGPDGSVAQAGVDACSARQFGIDAGREDGDSGKAAGGQRDRFDLRSIENIAVRGVDRVEQRIHIDFNRVRHGAHFQLRLERDGAVGLHQDARIALGRETFLGKGDGVFADGEIVEV